jgi:glycosyltransferase involved in cell wall biosynthesis
MYTSIEYLLAGLPIVSTRNIGGRDVYFDPEYCITTEADPEAIRAAVLELKARRIPRDHIRRRTLARIDADRQRFLDFLSALSVELPSTSRTQWPFPSKLLKWRPWQEFAREL